MRAVVVPAAPGLLPCRGQVDPFAEIRKAAVEALRSASASTATGVVVLGAVDVGRHLLSDAGYDGDVADASGTVGPGDLWVVAGDGSARRGEKAPGHLDPRASSYDEAVTTALAGGDAAVLADLDLALGEELLAAGAPALRRLGERVVSLGEQAVAELTYADDPFGVMYWVATWTTAPEGTENARMR